VPVRNGYYLPPAYGKIPRSFPEWTAAVAFIPSVGAQAGTGFADWGG